ncbi:ABC transporter ATP-binding protein/permease [Corynebacterium liangguodongii]|uniref:ABC transporter n=1 Tax=Corynebacterium liangguodongii TaxID=2079535 RepID=A0A2S0WE03_9CORY|nr:ATP-binding cassette domain-containing protein [Corynebacterium liangguodongii]AWB83892.1 ABC transporter [Corynebacterium liangguodongii]PWB99031.1 ABC transporter [Corynebacterium liangguodongii]
MASPIDPRLLRLAPPVRRFIVRAGVAQATTTILVIARGVLLGTTAAAAIEGRTERIGAVLVGLVAVALAHGAAAAAARRGSLRAAGWSVDTLRSQALAALARQDPRAVERDHALWRHVLTRGMEDFRPYITDFLPSLVSVAITTPIALATVFFFDRTSGFFALATLPLIPAFMALIGTLTAQRTSKRLRVTAGLGQQVGDLLQGAPTLRALGATRRPGEVIRAAGRRHETATMGVLRLAFLSSFALEFLATLSVALVAVSIGLRLVYGEVALLPALVVLIIVPEVFNPVRSVGTRYHAAADGLEAIDRVLTLIDAPAATTGSYLRAGSPGVEVRELSVSGRDGRLPAGLSFRARPGEITVLRGANGTGKTTTLYAILGALPDDAVTGSIALGGEVSYLSARPATVPGTVRENLQLFGAAAGESVPLVPGVGMERRIDPSARGVSAGELQRIGLARALAKSAPILLLDEPTAHLNPELAGDVLAALRAQANLGKTVLVASHDARLAAAAEQVVEL